MTKTLFELNLNKEEQTYFEAMQIQARRCTPTLMKAQIDYHNYIVERMETLELDDDDGRRIEFYRNVSKYFENMLLINC